jgi:hypothetical protein
MPSAPFESAEREKQTLLGKVDTLSSDPEDDAAEKILRSA